MRRMDLADLAHTDVYLIDQILKGRVPPGARVVDVGCGGGRNLPWFLRHEHPVVAVDPNPDAFLALDERLACTGLMLPESQRVVGTIEDAVATLPSAAFDLVICNAVLHFASSAAHFRAMLDASWELLAPGGVFFVRLTSSTGIEDRVKSLGNGRFLLPDESERYLVTEEQLLEETRRLRAEPLDPIKSTVVQRMRTMTTWVLTRS